ncbi:MAG: ADP-glyceromanno-heptose 6-epimerase [Alphaproteobacteria bacterium]|nr:ADP-glyceromanno-heptose 6-epimerase [Alphaproteobacteria bacterium]
MILVTGGAGFIGSNVVAALAERGSREIVVADSLGTGEKWQNLVHHEIAELIPPEATRDFVAANARSIEAIVHMGAVSATTERDADLIVESNFRLSLDLWRLAARRGIRLIYASSAATYGDGTEGFDDDGRPEALARLRPLNAYGWSKHAFDRRIARVVAEGGPRPPQWVGLKFFNVYGPNEYHKGEMRSLIAKRHAEVAAGAPLRLFESDRDDCADGDQKRDFIYVKDCAEVVLWLLDNAGVNGLFNLGSGRAQSWRELAGALFQALGLAERIEFVEMPEELRGRYQYFTQAPMERLRAAGYERPFTPLEAGVADYVRNHLGQPDPYR